MFTSSPASIGRETHQVCIVETQGGKIIGERAFPHGGEGLAAQLDRFRDRFTVAGAKDDRRDAHVLGDSLRTDRRAFRLLAVDDPTIIELREWSRIAAALIGSRDCPPARQALHARHGRRAEICPNTGPR